jgi:hypothetical protein
MGSASQATQMNQATQVTQPAFLPILLHRLEIRLNH